LLGVVDADGEKGACTGGLQVGFPVPEQGVELDWHPWALLELIIHPIGRPRTGQRGLRRGAGMRKGELVNPSMCRAFGRVPLGPADDGNVGEPPCTEVNAWQVVRWVSHVKFAGGSDGPD
jgi:hypothetical protein